MKNITYNIRVALCGHFQMCLKIKYIRFYIINFANFLIVKIKLLIRT